MNYDEDEVDDDVVVDHYKGNSREGGGGGGSSSQESTTCTLLVANSFRRDVKFDLNILVFKNSIANKHWMELYERTSSIEIPYETWRKVHPTLEQIGMCVAKSAFDSNWLCAITTVFNSSRVIEQHLTMLQAIVLRDAFVQSGKQETAVRVQGRKDKITSKTQVVIFDDMETLLAIPPTIFRVGLVDAKTMITLHESMQLAWKFTEKMEKDEEEEKKKKAKANA